MYKSIFLDVFNSCVWAYDWKNKNRKFKSTDELLEQVEDESSSEELLDNMKDETKSK